MNSMLRYAETASLKSFALVAAALTGLFSLLEFVEQLAAVGQGRYRVTDALVYVLLTAPSRLLQVTPVALLVGCLMALGGMARNSELTAMLSLGMSERQIIGSVLRLALPITMILFLLMQFVIPPAQKLAQEQRASALSSSLIKRTDNGFWSQHDGQYLNVQRFARGDIPIGIDIYGFGTGGILKSVLHADRADIRQDGTWLLTNVSRRRVHSWTIETDHLPTLSWRSFISPRQIQFLIIPLDSVPPLALFRHIHSLQPGQSAPRYEQELWSKLTLPLSLVAMIMAAAPFVFSSPRAQSSGRHLARGIAVGVVFSLGQQILNRVGLLLELNAAITATVPPLLVIAFSITLFQRRHRPGRRTRMLSPARQAS